MTGRPRILYHHRTRAFDGQAVHIQEMLEALEGAGAEVREVALVAQRGRGRKGPSLLGSLRLPRRAQEILEHLYTRTGRRLLLGCAREEEFDLVYERHALHCRAGLLAARELGLPFFLEVNAPLVDEMQGLGRLRFPGLARRAEREVLEGADRILVVTRVLGDLLVPLGADPEKVLVTPNGADPAFMRPAREMRRARQAGGTITLGFIGFPREWHRLDLALEAMARLRRPFPGLRLLVLGEGPALPRLKRRARELGLAKAFHCLGACPRSEMPRRIGELDFALIPAMNVYASPLKLYDALAAALPTLAPDQPNLRETVEDGVHAFLFAPGDQEAFCRRLRSMLENREEAERVGEAGLERLRELDLSFGANARRVIAEWKKVTGAR